MISIRVPDEILNKCAQQDKTETTLTYSFTNIFVKAAYNDKLSECFNRFDADEKLTIIEDYLGTKLDFEYYMMTGIVE